MASTPCNITWRASRRSILLAALSAPALAQEARPMRWVVPWPPGGSTDAIARLIASRVSPLLGQPVVIENRSGAGGVLGSEYVAKAAPDGLTALVSDGALATAPSLHRVLAFDPAKDLAPVVLAVTLPHVIAVRADFPATTLAQFVAAAKVRNLDFGSGGIGSPLHLAGELFRLAAGISWTHIPYRGSGPAITALLAGEVQVVVPSLPAVVAQIRDGRLRGLAVTGEARSPLLADVPTVREAGLPAAEMAGWVGLHVPAGAPPAPVQRVQAATQAALRGDELRVLLAGQGAQVVGGAAEQYGDFIAAETRKWSGVIRAAGIVPE